MAVWDDLVEEHRREGIGSLLEAEIRVVARRIISRYPPEVYSSGVTWADGIDDLVQDTVAALLADSGKGLLYIMQTSGSIDDFRALTGKRVRWTLTRGRRMTVLDSLLKRARSRMKADPFVVVGRIGRRDAYTVRGRPLAVAPPTAEELERAIRRVSAIPTVPAPAGERAPMVYTSPSLELVLLTIAHSVSGVFTERDVAAVLESVLTCWVPIVLDTDVEYELISEGAVDDDVSASLVVDKLLAETTAGHRRVLALWLRNVPHVEIAAELGCSRPTAAKRIDETLGFVRDELSGLSPRAQRLTIERLESVLGGVDNEP